MSIENVHYLNVFLGFGAILLQIFSIIILGTLFFGPKENKFLGFVDEHFLVFSFLIALFCSLFSLVYSEIIGFPPCELCWYQRVFMFPQIFLLGIALLEKNRNIIRYAMPLLFVGFIISIYQNFVYYFGDKASVPCDASGVSCYKQLVSEFGGYISIPMLSLTSFFAIMSLLLVAYFYKKEVL